MAAGPTEIGVNSQTVRQLVQNQIDQINNQLLPDPIWVMNNNKASVADQANGVITFNIVFPGLLNNTELSTVVEGYTTAGWTTASSQNIPPSPHDSPNARFWSLTLSYTPPSSP